MSTKPDGRSEKTDTPPVSPRATVQAQPEIQEYLEVSHEQHALFPPVPPWLACVRGLLPPSFAAYFSVLTHCAMRWSSGATRCRLWGGAFRYCTATGATLAVMLVRRYAPETSGSGIPHLKAVLHRLRDLSWFRVLIVKLFGGVLAIGSGLALGREGPTVQMGGAVGDGIARWLKISTRDCMTLTAAGAGAGLAAAFNAPLSGLVFVLEEV